MTIHLPPSLKEDTAPRFHLSHVYHFSIECSNKLLTITNAVIGLSMRTSPVTIQDIVSLEASYTDIVNSLTIIRDRVIDMELRQSLNRQN